MATTAIAQEAKQVVRAAGQSVDDGVARADGPTNVSVRRGCDGKPKSVCDALCLAINRDRLRVANLDDIDEPCLAKASKAPTTDAVSPCVRRMRNIDQPPLVSNSATGVHQAQTTGDHRREIQADDLSLTSIDLLTHDHRKSILILEDRASEQVVVVGDRNEIHRC